MTECKDILLVEDEPDLGAVLKRFLSNKGYQTDWAVSAEAALDTFLNYHYRLILIDIQLPGENGFQLAQKIKSIAHAQPIFFLTAMGGKENRKKGLEIGAFDYIEKPFEMDELLLKIRNILKFTTYQDRQFDNQREIVLGQSKLYKDRLLLIAEDGQTQSLTVREAEILDYLIENKNQLVLKKDILLKFWGNTDYFNGKSLEVFISRIRKLLRAEQSIKIENVYGAGYIFTIKNNL